jgi:hypothetical protein
MDRSEQADKYKKKMRAYEGEKEEYDTVREANSKKSLKLRCQHQKTGKNKRT